MQPTKKGTRDARCICHLKQLIMYKHLTFLIDPLRSIFHGWVCMCVKHQSHVAWINLDRVNTNMAIQGLPPKFTLAGPILRETRKMKVLSQESCANHMVSHHLIHVHNITPYFRYQKIISRITKCYIGYLLIKTPHMLSDIKLDPDLCSFVRRFTIQRLLQVDCV